MADKPPLRIAPNALLRIAGWPIETALAFASSELQQLAVRIAQQEQTIITRRPALLNPLHALVPLLNDPLNSRYALKIKRHVYNYTTSFPEPPDGFIEQIGPNEVITSLFWEEVGLRNDLAQCRDEYKILFDQVLSQQRELLLEITQTDHFQKALLLANGPLWKLVQQKKINRHQSSRKQSRVVTTLFSYLMRAVGRPTPHMGWSGIAPVRPAEFTNGGLQVDESTAKFQVTVALQPFAEAIDALTTLSRYRDDYPLRLNPTLIKTVSGWTCEACKSGQLGTVELPEFPLSGVIADYFANGKVRPITPLLDVLATNSGIDHLMLNELKEWLINSDVLRVDLALPLKTDTVWKTLEAITPQLHQLDQNCWQQTIEQIRLECSQLEQYYAQTDLVLLERSLAEIRKMVDRLWQHCGVVSNLPDGLVYIDQVAPFCGFWDLSARQSVTEAIRQWLSFHYDSGQAEFYRQQTYQAIKQMTGGEQSLVNAFAVFATRQESDSGSLVNSVQPYTQNQVLKRFENTILDCQVADNHSVFSSTWHNPSDNAHALIVPSDLADQMPPLNQYGSVLLSGNSKSGWRMGQGRPQPGLFASRFSALLTQKNGYSDTILTDIEYEFRDCFQGGMSTVELFGDDCANRNAALRPQLASTVLSVHQHQDGELDPAQLSLLYDDVGQRVWLTTPNGTKHIPVYNSAAAIGHSLASARLLWLCAMTHGWEYLSYGLLPSEEEVLIAQHCPRLVSTNGTMLSDERWIVDGPTLRQLEQLSESERYLAWQTEQHRQQIPALVYAHWNAHEPPFLFVTSSPMALNCLFGKIKADTPNWLVLYELPDNLDNLPVRDNQNQHYLAELAVSWFYDGVSPTN